VLTGEVGVLWTRSSREAMARFGCTTQIPRNGQEGQNKINHGLRAYIPTEARQRERHRWAYAKKVALHATSLSVRRSPHTRWRSAVLGGTLACLDRAVAVKLRWQVFKVCLFIMTGRLRFAVMPNLPLGLEGAQVYTRGVPLSLSFIRHPKFPVQISV
jgi:hypothetical protein